MDTKLLGLILQGDKRIAREITDFKNTLSDAGLTESGAIVQTAAGESIITRDSSDDGLKGLRVFGKSEQKTYSGKNLFNKDHATYVSHISYSNNVYILNGDERTRLYYLPIEPNTDYYVSKTIGANLRVCVSSEVPAVDVKVSTINSNTSSSECVISSGTTGKYLGLYVLWSAELDAGMTYESVLDTVMVAKSNSAVPYEPYTGGIPSPNPNFPQEITSVGDDDGELEVGVYGKNLLTINLKKGEKITLTANKDDYQKTYTDIYADLKAGESYVFSMQTDGNIVEASKEDTVEMFLLKDRSYDIILGASKLRKEVFTVPVDGRYHLRLDVNKNGCTHSFWDIMIRLASIEDDTYELYKPAQSLPISTPNGLPGIKVTDASLATYTDAEGNMWCADEIDFERGVYVKRIGDLNVVNSDIIDWGAGGGGHDFYIKAETWDTNTFETRNPGAICTHFALNTGGTFTIDAFKYSTHNNDGWGGKARICFRVPSEIDTVEKFKEYVGTDCYVQYVLKTPIETPLTESELNAYKALHTNCPVTTVLNDSGAHMELTYNADTKSYIDNKFTELTNAILSMGGNV